MKLTLELKDGTKVEKDIAVFNYDFRYKHIGYIYYEDGKNQVSTVQVKDIKTFYVV